MAATTTTKIRIISVATDLIMTISIKKVVVRAKVITWAIAEITTITICNNGTTIAKMVVASRTSADDSK